MEFSTKIQAPSFFLRILVAISLTCALSVFGSSVLLFFSYQNVAVSEAVKADKDRLVQWEYAADQMLSETRRLAEQVLGNNLIASKLFFQDLTPGTDSLLSALRTFESYRRPFPAVESMYLYNGTQERWFVASEAGPRIVRFPDSPDAGIAELVARAVPSGQLHPFARTVNRSQSDGWPLRADLLTFLYWGTAPVKDGRPLYALVINLKAESLRARLNKVSQEMLDSAFGFDQTGTVILGNGEHPLLSPLAESPAAGLKGMLKGSEGSLTQNTDDRSVYNYATLSDLGWTFVQVTKVDRLSAKMAPLRDLLWLVVASMLAVGLTLSVFVARGLYAPFGSLEKQLRELAGRREKADRDAQEGRLRSFLAGRTSDESLFQAGGRYSVLAVTLADAPGFWRHYPPTDRQQVRALVREIATTKLGGIACPWDERTEMLVHPVGEAGEGVSRLRQGVIEEVGRQVGLPVYLTFLDQPLRPNELPGAALRTFDASQQHFWSGAPQIDAAKVVYQDDDGLSYPVEAEARVLQHLQKHDLSGLKLALRTFLGALQGFRLPLVQTALVQLSSRLFAEMDNLARRNRRVPLVRFSEFLDRLTLPESEESVLAHIEQIVGGFLDDLNRQHEEPRDERVLAVRALIHREYTDRNLSLKTIADRLAITSGYLGRLYLKETGLSVAEAITQARLEAARDLLVQTDTPINRIARMVGFTNGNYFHPLFKKFEGLTPAEYRGRYSTTSQSAK